MKFPHRLAVVVSLALPVLLLAGMAGQAEWALRGGVVIRVPITGYDPRDPLRGHFLRYRIAWNWADGEPDGDVAALCVTSRAENPVVRALSLQDRGSCFLPVKLQMGKTPRFMPIGVPEELFVPEASAAALQTAMRASGTAITIDLSVGPDETARIGGWHADGQ